MSTVHAGPRRRSGALAPPSGRSALRLAGTAVLVLAVALGVLARLHSPSALWLDEALSLGISRRPVPDLLHALRRDGSPPLYYLLLHAWIGVFGTSTGAVRALSTVFSLAALPLVWLAGRRLGGRRTADAALLLLAVNPFAVRYATETRMYALIQLLAAALLLALLRARERPAPGRLLPVALLSGLLALTHYWALFLLAAMGAVLLVAALRSRGRPAPQPAGRLLAALAAGAVLFVPWVPNFLFQMRHTGTPWAPAPRLVDTWNTVVGWAGGAKGPAVVLTLTLTALAVLALAGRPGPAEGGHGTVVLGRPLDRTALLLLAGSAGTLLLGLVVGMQVAAGYSLRYSSVALVPALLLAALGLRALPERARLLTLALVALTGLLTSLPQLTSTRRTEAAVTAETLSRGLSPGDVVVYCPDQLGPAVSRLLPAGTDQVVYPTMGSPELVDWVDYAQRNAKAFPAGFASELTSRTSGAIWLVSAGGYLTFGNQCAQLGTALDALRGTGTPVHGQSSAYDEQQAVTRFPSAAEVAPAP